MKALDAVLGEPIVHEHRPGADELESVLLKTVRAGDAVMVKSSKGIGFSRLVKALVDKYPAVSDSVSERNTREGVSA